MEEGKGRKWVNWAMIEEKNGKDAKNAKEAKEGREGKNVGEAKDGKIAKNVVEGKESEKGKEEGRKGEKTKEAKAKGKASSIPIAASIEDRDIEDEMKESYLSYAMSVIVARAIPDVRDGLKPVHRRILYAMHEIGNTFDGPYKKSARIVGEVLGKFHPHGDMAVYDTLVRMAQTFSLRYPLVAGQGNFGSIDGDPPAAMRYTEVKMAKISSEMVKELGEDTVDFVPNFDNTLKEPAVLPARVPQLLINGSSGIAVAMVSNIPPHNLTEVADALLATLDGKSKEEVLSYVKGPDFPTGGIVTHTEGLRKAYETGKGKIVVMAKAEIKDNKIVFTEIPYQVTKTRIIDDIVKAVKNNVIHGIVDVHDRSDKRGLHLEVVVKKGYNPQNVLQKLYEHTALRVTYGIISIALVRGKPRLLPLYDLLSEFLAFREEVIKRRTQFRLAKAEKRAHILEGLLKALKDIDKAVAILKGAKDVTAAKLLLKRSFGIDDEQAQAILDMKLQKIVGLERKKLEDELGALQAQIEEFTSILSNREKLLAVIRSELLEVKQKYGDERRTEILEDYTPHEIVEKAIVIHTAEGYIKRVHPSALKAQHRGGVGMRITAQNLHVRDVVSATTVDNLLVFTDLGKVHKVSVSSIPIADRYAKGMYLGNLIKLGENEKPLTIVKAKDAGYVVMVTQRGLMKRVAISAFDHIRAGGIRAINFKEGDKLADVTYGNGDELVFVATREGKAIIFPQEQIRAMGRAAAGVRAIRLSEGDAVVNVSLIPRDEFDSATLERAERAEKDAEESEKANAEKDEKGLSEEQQMSERAEEAGEAGEKIVPIKKGGILTVTSMGYGRFTSPKLYRVQRRGGSGIINVKLKEGEHVVFSKYVHKESDILLSSKKGMILRTSCQQIPMYGRASRGVRLIKVKDDEVSSVVVLT